MAAASNVAPRRNWVFSQSEGTKHKVLVLDGWNAPFGRQRKEPVITETLKSRIQTTRYPGSNAQTRHAFGTNWEAATLKGRWMTKAQTDGRVAEDVAADWVDFFQDECTCYITWGSIVSWFGYIEELTLAREDENNISWSMKLQLDKRADTKTKSLQIRIVPPADNLAAIQAAFVSLGQLQTPLEESISPDLLDSLDNLAAEINKPQAELNALATRFGDLTKASYSTLQHFRGAIVGLETAVATFHDTIVNTAVDIAILVRSAENDVAWCKYVANVDNQTYLILDELNKLDRTAELAQNQPTTKFVTAWQNCSWEDISIKATGGPSQAGAIRDANGIRYGYAPIPGETYLVP